MFATIVVVARADDLDVIANRTASAEAKGQAYERLCQADFSTFAAKLATIYGGVVAEQRNGLIAVSGIGPMTAQPWAEVRLSEGDRIAYTLRWIWDYKLKTAKTQGECMNLMLDVIENPSVGEGRRMAVMQLDPLFKTYIYSWDSSMPPMEEMLARLERRAFDQKEPNDFRQWVLAVVIQYGDPNRCLDLAIQLVSAQESPLDQMETFRFCTPLDRSGQLSAENRKKFLRFGFQLLERGNNGHSGNGYHLASHLGRVLQDSQILPKQPLRPGTSAFEPVIGPHRTDYFQDTVDNALGWWRSHQVEY
jgi:hypothetical protein